MIKRYYLNSNLLFFWCSQAKVRRGYCGFPSFAVCWLPSRVHNWLEATQNFWNIQQCITNNLSLLWQLGKQDKGNDRGLACSGRQHVPRFVTWGFNSLCIAFVHYTFVSLPFSFRWSSFVYLFGLIFFQSILNLLTYSFKNCSNIVSHDEVVSRCSLTFNCKNALSVAAYKAHMYG